MLQAAGIWCLCGDPGRLGVIYSALFSLSPMMPCEDVGYVLPDLLVFPIKAGNQDLKVMSPVITH